MVKKKVTFLIKISLIVLFTFLLVVINRREKEVKKIRIFCFILISTNGYLSGKGKIIDDVWAKKCDQHRYVTVVNEQDKLKFKNFFVSSNLSSDFAPPLIQPAGLLTKYNFSTKDQI